MSRRSDSSLRPPPHHRYHRRAGRLVARRVGDHFEVVGVDRAPWEGHPGRIRVHVLDLRRRKLEDIFRKSARRLSSTLPLSATSAGIRGSSRGERAWHEAAARVLRKPMAYASSSC